MLQLGEDSGLGIGAWRDLEDDGTIGQLPLAGEIDPAERPSAELIDESKLEEVRADLGEKDCPALRGPGRSGTH
jgi:hypothetical protein